MKKRSNGPRLLILDNFSGHDELQELDGVTYFFLPANTMAKDQPLDQGIISQAKIMYRSIILRETIDIDTRMQQPNHGFESSSGNGRWVSSKVNFLTWQTQ